MMFSLIWFVDNHMFIKACFKGFVGFLVFLRKPQRPYVVIGFSFVWSKLDLGVSSKDVFRVLSDSEKSHFSVQNVRMSELYHHTHLFMLFSNSEQRLKAMAWWLIDWQMLIKGLRLTGEMVSVSDVQFIFNKA